MNIVVKVTINLSMASRGLGRFGRCEGFGVQIDRALDPPTYRGIFVDINTKADEF
jgi:hypothetical protein